MTPQKDIATKIIQNKTLRKNIRRGREGKREGRKEEKGGKERRRKHMHTRASMS